MGVKLKLTNLTNKVTTALASVKHPGVFLGLGIAGFCATIGLTIYSTNKAKNKIEKKKEELNITKLSPKDTLKTVWTCYIPVAGAMAGSLLFFVLGDRTRKIQYQVMEGVASVMSTAYAGLKDSVEKSLPEETAKTVISDHQKDISKNENMKQFGTAMMANDGTYMWLEPISGRYIKTTWNDIQRAANEANSEAMKSLDGELTCSMWFEKLNLDPTSTSEDIGWKVWDRILRISPSSTIGRDNVPCGVIEYDTEPTYLR